MPDRPVCNSVGLLAPGVDVRGTGGYAVVPPSIHPTGRAYAWSVDTANAFAPAPAWLLERIAERRTDQEPAPSSTWSALIADGVDEGRRNCAVARLAGYLLRHRCDDIVRELLHLWNMTRCRPPLPAEEIEQVIASIAAREERRRAVE